MGLRDSDDIAAGMMAAAEYGRDDGHEEPGPPRDSDSVAIEAVAALLAYVDTERAAAQTAYEAGYTAAESDFLAERDTERARAEAAAAEIARLQALILGRTQFNSRIIEERMAAETARDRAIEALAGVWQFNEAVSMLNEAVRVTATAEPWKVDAETGSPAIMDALRNQAAVLAELTEGAS